MSQADPNMDDEDFGKKPPKSAFDADNLDHFLHSTHGETAVGNENGMPALDWIKDNFKSKSGAIRYLAQLGFDAKQIALHLRIKYQHAYNVMNQHLKRGPNEVYIEQAWQCPHTTAAVVIDIVVRKGSRDPDGTRVLFRVCSDCGRDIIPGVTAESIAKALPGVK